MNALRAEYFDSLGRFLVKKRKPNVRKLKVVIGWQIEFSPNVSGTCLACSDISETLTVNSSVEDLVQQSTVIGRSEIDCIS